jgi:hypothetical protein
MFSKINDEKIGNGGQMQRQKVVTEWRQRKGTASIEKLGRVRE